MSLESYLNSEYSKKSNKINVVYTFSSIYDQLILSEKFKSNNNIKNICVIDISAIKTEEELQQYQAFIRTGTMAKSKENGDLFQNDLDEMVRGLQENIPGIGIYIWNYNEDPKTHNTQHTIISGNVFDKLEDGVSVADWIYAAVNNDVQSHGLELLGK